MAENFVLEMARGINGPGQQRIDRFLELIKEANRLQRELARVLLEAAEIQRELNSGSSFKDRSKDDKIFELTTPDNKTLLVYNPSLVAPPGSILTMVRDDYWFGETELDELKSLSEIKISFYARCPDVALPRKIARMLCPKYERGLNKNGIDNYDKCDGKCIYCSGDFDGDGWNGDGYKIDKIKLRLFRVKI